MGWPGQDWFSWGPRLSPTHKIMKAEFNHLSSLAWIAYSDLTLSCFTVATLKGLKGKFKFGDFTLISNHWLVSLLTDLRGEGRKKRDRPWNFIVLLWLQSELFYSTHGKVQGYNLSSTQEKLIINTKEKYELQEQIFPITSLLACY